MKTSAFWLLAYADRSSSDISAVVVSRQKHAQAQTTLDHRPQPARHRERDVFFERARRSARAPASSPPWPASMTMVRTPVRRQGEADHRRQVRRVARGASGCDRCGRRRGGSAPAGSSSMISRDAFASGCEVVAR